MRAGFEVGFGVGGVWDLRGGGYLGIGMGGFGGGGDGDGGGWFEGGVEWRVEKRLGFGSVARIAIALALICI